MDKLIHIGKGNWGEKWESPYFVLFDGSMTKQAGETHFHPRTQKYIDEQKSSFGQDDVVLVLTPLGVFEAWGSNANGDSFLEEDIAPIDPDWGHRSFEKHAKFYRHHRNKDPEQSFGTIPIMSYDPIMRRPEGIAKLSRSKAEKVGSGDLVKDLDGGKPVDISMGTKVKFDRCSICRHESKTTSEYCDHLKNHMNEILPDGKLVHAENPRPRFFDLSGVTVRAAKEAAILQKVAEVGGRIFSADLSNLEMSEQKLPKEVFKKESELKLAELTKIFPEVFHKIVWPMYQQEEPLSESVLDLLGQFSFPRSLASLASLGIVLRPREFQRIYLVRNGRPDLSDELHGKKIVFSTEKKESEGRYHLFPEDIVENLAHDLMGLLPSRSLLQPFVGKRIVIVIQSKSGKKPEPDLVEKKGSVLDEVAREYAKYTRGMAYLPNFLKGAMARYGGIYDVFSGASFDPMVKVAGFGKFLLPALGIVIPTYLLAAHWQEAEEEGKDLGILENFVANHPLLTSVGIMTGLGALGHRSMRETGP